MRQYFENLWHNWLQQRQPKSAVFTLNRHNLYTFPGTSGLMYLGLTLILWLIGTNYQNNLILALAYGLISLFVVAILHAYANLAGITITALPPKDVFTGEVASLPLQFVSSNKRGAENVRCQFRDQMSIAVELQCQIPSVIELPLRTGGRGWQSPGRLLIETYYPLGLIRCWTWLHLEQSVLVYPAPVAEPIHLGAEEVSDELAATVGSGDSEFDGLRKYRPGDTRKLIAWKALAKGMGLLSKQFVQEQGKEQWLDINKVNGPVEHRLSVMSHWVLQLSAHNKKYGMRLNALIIAPDQGDAHRATCLRALAEYKG